MAKKKESINEVITNRLISLDTDLDGLTPGSEEHSRCIKDISLLANATAELKKVEAQVEDNEAKREEQKRMNDQEIEFKKTQIEIDTARMENEKFSKGEMLKFDFIRLAVDAGTNFLAQGFYYGIYSKAMRNEYHASGGTSMTPPTYIRNLLNDTKPKKKF